jgi:hypothetical protein
MDTAKHFHNGTSLSVAVSNRYSLRRSFAKTELAQNCSTFGKAFQFETHSSDKLAKSQTCGKRVEAGSGYRIDRWMDGKNKTAGYRPARFNFLRFDYRYDLSESAQSCKPNVHP